MDLIEKLLSTPATSSVAPPVGVILLILIPFIIVGLVVGTVFFMRLRQKRDMRDI